MKRLRAISRDLRRSTEVNRDLLYEPDEHLKRDAEFPRMRGYEGTRSGLPCVWWARRKPQSAEVASGPVTSIVSNGRTDRVAERRRAVALARHFREAEGLSIAQIGDRLGRSPATIKAYFYDPTGEKRAARDHPVAS